MDQNVVDHPHHTGTNKDQDAARLDQNALMLQSSKDEIDEWKKSEHVLAKISDKKDEKPKSKSKNRKYGYCSLYRFATKLQMVFMIFGVICAIGAGICVPVISFFLHLCL